MRSAPIAFENCGLCGDTLEGALDIETGVCSKCAKLPVGGSQ